MTVTLSIADYWRAAAADLGLRVVAPYAARLPSGATLTADVFIADVGGERGMLLLSDSSVLVTVAADLETSGFGCSVLSPPLPGEVYRRQDVLPLLHDWGWSSGPS